MKQFLIIGLIILFSSPVFAVPGEYTILEDGTKVCDNSDIEGYFTKLEKEFFEKHNGVFTGNDYNREVMSPLFKYSSELQKKGHCGYEGL
ncbi:MAG: hypothetical protein LUH05_03670 [Candidatus Gastranaerophilales bacterium]|nr:hypothetical protein [Candidatus Gastranaerophilales bacterium]